jgi:hypothetical protein
LCFAIDYHKLCIRSAVVTQSLGRHGMSTKKSVAAVTNEIYELLLPLEPGDRERAVSAAQTLLGMQTQASSPNPSGPSTTVGNPPEGNVTAQAYFAQKQPRSVSEAYAVAARFREITSREMEHTKEQFAAVFKAARRSFDSRNSSRDIGNARISGYFTRGSENSLSDYGQRYIDSLPDRSAANSLRIRKPAKKAKKPRKST